MLQILILTLTGVNLFKAWVISNTLTKIYSELTGDLDTRICLESNVSETRHNLQTWA